MPTYSVILTRDTTESVVLTVDADSPEDAEEKVMDMAGRYGQDLPLEDQRRWQPDDCTCGDAYITDVSKEDEVEWS
jgi:hypothetical protein